MHIISKRADSCCEYYADFKHKTASEKIVRFPIGKNSYKL